MDATTEFVRPVEVEARGRYRLWLRFSDGVEGEVDLSDFAGQGVFAAWEDPAFFEAVRIDETRAVCWGDDVDLCPDALYLELTGMTPERYLPGLRRAQAGGRQDRPAVAAAGQARGEATT